MELAKRLAAAAVYIPKGSIAADIGTDHAYLPIYLIEKGICSRVIATELNSGPFESAKNRLKDFRFSDKIDLRLGSGLKALRPGEADVLVLAGMGGNTIREILAEEPDILKTVGRLVLQPMADPGDLRAWLAANGWMIIDEKLVQEDGRIYVVVAADPGHEKIKDPVLLELGPRLLEKKDPLMKVYIEKITDRYERVLTSLSGSNSDGANLKACELKTKLDRIREVTGWL